MPITQVFPSKPFIGSGFDYPFQITPATGGMSKGIPNTDAATLEKIYDALKQLIFVSKGSRFMRRDWGTAVPDLAFEPSDSGKTDAILKTILNDIAVNEKRVIVLDSSITSAPGRDGRLFIKLTVSIVNSNQVGNLTFPYYTTKGQ